MLSSYLNNNKCNLELQIKRPGLGPGKAKGIGAFLLPMSPGGMSTFLISPLAPSARNFESLCQAKGMVVPLAFTSSGYI